MALTFGNSGSNSAQGVQTLSFNNNGDFILLFVEGSTVTTGATYNGVAMTKIGTTLSHTGYSREMTLWGLVAPASGANNLVISGGSNENFAVVSITGVDPANPYTGFNSNYQASTTSGTVSVTTTVAGAYVVGGNLFNFTAVGAGTTLIANMHGNAYEGIYRSDEIASPSSNSLAVTYDAGAPSGWLATGINPIVEDTSNSEMFLVF